MPHPDKQIEQQYRDNMQLLACDLDVFFNGNLRGKDRKVCFTLLVTSFANEGTDRCNYISNGERADIISMMKEMIARFEGQPELKGTA